MTSVHREVAALLNVNDVDACVAVMHIREYLESSHLGPQLKDLIPQGANHGIITTVERVPVISVGAR